MFEKWITPFFSKMVTPKGPDDDLPIREEEELMGHAP